MVDREDEPELVPGSMLGHLYRVVRRLGGGGHGDVYEVEHTRLATRFAAKILKSSLCARPEYIARFHREAHLASRIDHPHIARVVNLDQTSDGRHYVIMELLRGRSLAEELERGPLAVREACRIAREIALGLSIAHAEGIVHRDLKPQNVLLTETAGGVVAKVTDFGISKVEDGASKLTETGSLLGTPLYMAPEHAQDPSSIDHRADVYALGATLYEMLAGRPPFVGATTISVLYQHIDKAPAAIDGLRPEVSAELAALVHRMLEKDPAKRPQSMAEVAQALESIAGAPAPVVESGSRSIATPVASAAAAPFPPRAHRLPLSPAAMVAFVLAVAVAGTVLFLYTRDRAALGREQRKKLEQEIYEARDLLSGQVGAPIVYRFTDDPLAKERARRILDGALAVDPDYAFAHEIMAYYFMSKRDWQSAKHELEVALEKDPASVRAWTGLGRVYSELNDRSEEENAWRRALAIDAAFPPANVGLARLIATAYGHHEEALAHYERALATDPDCYGASYGKGLSLWHLGRTEEAVGAFEREAKLRKSPWAANALFELGGVYFRQKAWTRARDSYREVLATAPSFARAPDVRRYLARIDAEIELERALATPESAK